MALPGGGYDGAAIKIANTNVFIPEIWSQEIKRFRDQSFILKNSVKLVPMVGKKGDLIHIPSISRMAVYDKLPETPVTLQARTEGEYTIVIDKYKESSFMIEDIVGIQAAYGLRSFYTQEAGYALSRDLDNFLLGLRADINAYTGQVVWNTSTGASGGTPLALNRAAILAAKQILDEADVPMMGRKLVVSPGQYNDLLTVDEFISADYVNGRPTSSGTVGTLFGMEVLMTTQVTTNSTTGYVNGTGGTPSPTPGVAGSYYMPSQFTATPVGLPTSSNSLPVATALMYHPDWAILSMQLNPKVESSREVLFQADAVVATQIYGAKVYRPDHAVLIHSAP